MKPTYAQHLARSMSPHLRRMFLLVHSTDWHRIDVDRQRGGRWRNFLRLTKLTRMGVVDHRTVDGAQYRLTDLGMTVRAALLAERQEAA